MLISGRRAAARLEAAGLTNRQARRVLAAGFAGAPVRTSAALLFEQESVEALAAWPVLSDDLVAAALPGGAFVARRDVDLLPGAPDLVEALRGGWALSPLTAVWIRVRIGSHGHLPLVATVGGFVAGGAEITGLVTAGASGYRLDLRAPGPWFDALAGRRLPTGPGRPWVVLGWQPSTPRGRRWHPPGG
jgi:hypothetical protein